MTTQYNKGGNEMLANIAALYIAGFALLMIWAGLEESKRLEKKIEEMKKTGH